MSTDGRPAEISGEEWAATPVAVRALVLALQAENARLRTTVERLETRLTTLEARLNQSSRTSSQPPSSDPPSVPPRSSRRPSDRRRGGQPGHPGHARDLLPPEQVDHVVRLVPPQCQGCGVALAPE